MKENMKKMAQRYDELYSTLGDEQKLLFEKLNDASMELADVSEREIFVYAFRLGAKFTLEIMK